MSRAIPLKIMLIPTSVPMTHAALSGQVRQIITAKIKVIIASTNSHPEPGAGRKRTARMNSSTVFCRLGKSLSCCWKKGWMIGAVEIENNGVRNFKNLRGTTRNTKSLKKNEEACRGILIAPSKLPRFSRLCQISSGLGCSPAAPLGKAASDTNLVARMASRRSS